MTETPDSRDQKMTDATQSVSGQVLQAFINALAAKPGFEDIAARLKGEIIDRRNTSEAALRRALFGDDGS